MKNGNGEGTVYKLSGNRRKPWRAVKTIGWELVSSKKARQKRKVIGDFKTKSEALEALIHYEYDPKMEYMRCMTVEKIYMNWRKEHDKKISENTQKIYNSMYSSHLSKIKEKIFSELRHIHWQHFIDTIQSPASRKTMKAMLKGMYIYAMKLEIVDKNYSELIDTGVVVQKVTRRNFTKEEIDILWNDKNEEYVDSILVLLYTGLRVNELLQLEWKEVFLDERYLKTGSKTEAGKDRLIPIHPKIFPIFQKWKELSCSRYVYIQENGKPYGYFAYRTRFIRTLEKLGIEEHTIHDTRQTFISRMDSMNVNKVSLIHMVGHANEKTGQKTYIHKEKEELQQAMNLLEY